MKSKQGTRTSARQRGAAARAAVQKTVAVGTVGTSRLSTPTNTWHKRYGKLVDFKAEHGHCNVPKSQGSFRSWVDNQRFLRKKGQLSEERVQKLDALGYVWNPYPTWDERLDELTRYKAEHGHSNVPQSQGSLGGWASKQRQARKKDKLSEERVQKLDDLGFNWSPRGSPESKSVDASSGRRSGRKKVSKGAKSVLDWDKNHDMIAAGKKSKELEKWFEAQRQLALSGNLGHNRRDKIMCLNKKSKASGSHERSESGKPTVTDCYAEV